MAIVTHEMDFAKDVSNRVLYMDEGCIYEEGNPKRIFENPQKEKTKAFINRTRSFNYRIGSPNYDLYAMNAEIEAFCEKQILPKKTRLNLLLLTEEILQLYNPYLDRIKLDVTIAYSEKNETLELTWEHRGEALNPIEAENTPDDFGLAIIRNLAQRIDYQRVDDLNRVCLLMKKG